MPTRRTVACPLCSAEMTTRVVAGVDIIGRWLFASAFAVVTMLIDLAWFYQDRRDFGEQGSEEHWMVLLLGTPIRFAIAYGAWPYLRHAAHTRKADWRTWAATWAIMLGGLSVEVLLR